MSDAIRHDFLEKLPALFNGGLLLVNINHMQYVKEDLKWTAVAWTNVSMTEAMQLDSTLKYF